jgi:all-trans-retinol 13,14-reductase
MKSYDIVIIGSGMGALTCGYILSKEGYSICILEKNRQFGGNLQTFSRDKCIFDTGVHYLGGLDKGQNLYKYFSYLGILKELKLKRMDEIGFDKITFKGDQILYPHSMGYENFIKSLSAIFPNNENELINYCNTIKNICSQFPMYNVMESDGKDIDITLYSKSAFEFINETISNPKLRDVLSGSIMLYGGQKDNSSLYQHALVINSYIESSWRCIDGGSQITKLMVRNIKNNGGDLYNYAEVKKINTVDGKAVSVELTDGREFFGSYFISNVHPAITLDLIEPKMEEKLYQKRIKSLKNSTSCFSLHIVFKPNTFPYMNYNIYHFETNDIWNAENYSEENWPPAYMACTPASSKSEEFADSMTVLTYMKMEEVKEWENSIHIIPNKNNLRAEAYEDFKIQKAEKLLVLLNEKFPGIRNKIKSIHTSTPLTYRDYINTPDGSIYGVVKDYKNMLGTFISHRTKIPNLFLTGQNLNSHGILGVIVTAIKTCTEFIDYNTLIKKVNDSY